MDQGVIFLGILFAGVVLSFVLDTFYPERSMERELRRLERKLERLKKRDRWARIMTWVDVPFLKGDVDRYIFLLEQERALLKRELMIYKWIREGSA